MMVQGILKLLLFYSLIIETDGLKNYVTPNEITQCSIGWSNCLTLEEYASQPDDYFKNNTIFEFEPGSHGLNRSLTFTNLHNFTILGKRSEVINVLLGPLVCIAWENCSNIEISSISFILLEDFIFGIIFEHSHLIQLSDISIHGNKGNIGCSSVLSQYSTIHIQDSKFAGIRGSYGAAMMISRSCVVFTGNNIFSDNSAHSGGSLYILLESVVTLSGINTFVNNTSEHYVNFRRIRCFEDAEYDIDWVSCSGGAIYCRSSTLNINSEYSVFANNFAQKSGGAIEADDGNIITIKGSVTFMKNAANDKGGAIFLYYVTLRVSGDISFINNEADFGGALSILRAKFLFVDGERMENGKSTFNAATVKVTEVCRNVAMNGSIESDYVSIYNSHFNESGKGKIVFRGNMAYSEGGGIKGTDNSVITILNFDERICFENNTAIHGGGMYLGINSKLEIILSPSIQRGISFVLNHAHRFGGALYVDDSQCSTVPKECFLYIDGYTTTEVLLLFSNNSAGSMGSALYGGQLHECVIYFTVDTTMVDYDEETPYIMNLMH